MTDLIRQGQMRDILFAKVAEVGGMVAFANIHGIAVSTVSEVVNGKRDVTEALANVCGFMRVAAFRQIAKQENG